MEPSCGAVVIVALCRKTRQGCCDGDDCQRDGQCEQATFDDAFPRQVLAIDGEGQDPDHDADPRGSTTTTKSVALSPSTEVAKEGPSAPRTPIRDEATVRYARDHRTPGFARM